MLFRRQRFRQNSSRIFFLHIHLQVVLKSMKILGLTQGMSLWGTGSEICHHYNIRNAFRHIRQQFDNLFHLHPPSRFFHRRNIRNAFRRTRQWCLYDGEDEATMDNLNRRNFFSRFFHRRNTRNAFRRIRQCVRGVSTNHGYAHFDVCVQVVNPMFLEFRIQIQEWL